MKVFVSYLITSVPEITFASKIFDVKEFTKLNFEFMSNLMSRLSEDSKGKQVAILSVTKLED